MAPAGASRSTGEPRNSPGRRATHDASVFASLTRVRVAHRAGVHQGPFSVVLSITFFLCSTPYNTPKPVVPRAHSVETRLAGSRLLLGCADQRVIGVKRLLDRNG